MYGDSTIRTYLQEQGVDAFWINSVLRQTHSELLRNRYTITEVIKQEVMMDGGIPKHYIANVTLGKIDEDGAMAGQLYFRHIGRGEGAVTINSDG